MALIAVAYLLTGNVHLLLGVLHDLICCSSEVVALGSTIERDKATIVKNNIYGGNVNIRDSLLQSHQDVFFGSRNQLFNLRKVGIESAHKF